MRDIAVIDHTDTGKKVVARVSRTTGIHGTKANFGQKIIARVSQTTGSGTEPKMDERYIAQSSWATSYHQQKVGTTSSRHKV